MWSVPSNILVSIIAEPKIYTRVLVSVPDAQNFVVTDRLVFPRSALGTRNSSCVISRCDEETDVKSTLSCIDLSNRNPKHLMGSNVADTLSARCRYWFNRADIIDSHCGSFGCSYEYTE